MFDSAFASCDMGVAATTAQGTILRWNRALSDMLGREALAGFVLPQANRDGEVELRRCDGTSLWAQVFQSPLSVPFAGSPAGATSLLYCINIHERRRKLQQFAHSNSHDALTGLRNRTGFIEALVASLELENRQVCLFLDLDEFKPVNDSLGHAAGDALLVSAAAKLKGLVSSRDTVARLHGDEFAVLLADCDEEQAVAFGEAAQALLQEPATICGRQIIVSASIGVVMLTPEHTTAEGVLRDADAAMYRAKQLGRRCVVLFDQSMRRELERQARLKTDLPMAIASGGIRVTYQPIVDLTTLQVAGFEALARWNHPLEGDIAPMEFIALAERSESIVAIGKLVLSETCKFMAVMDEAGFPGLSCAVNLSVRQIQDGNLVSDVAGHLAQYGLSPGRLTLELTEGTVLEDRPEMLARLRELRDLGVSLSLDDFGTGYSSLRYLHQFPIDILKIDRTFVNGPDGKLASEAIVDMVTNLARSLDMIVIAEGVEHPAQADLLSAHGCRFGQGFYFAEALESHAVHAWLNMRNA